MSNPPPSSDASASQGPPALPVNTDPWNLRDILTFLPTPLRQLVNNILGHCRVACSEDVEGANAITRELSTLLQQLVEAIDNELQSSLDSNLCSGLRTSSDFQGQNLLGRLAEGINRHFKERPKTMVISADADMQSAAFASRSIKECFLRLVELLSTDEDRAGNIATLTIELMDTEVDPEIALRTAIFEHISRHVVASFKQPDNRWEVTIDGEVWIRGSSGSNAHLAPKVLEVASAALAAAACGELENFDGANCCLCQYSVFELANGIVTFDAREMKCECKLTIHSKCSAIDWFIEKKSNTCPVCSYDFSDEFSVDIKAYLDHDQLNGPMGIAVRWMKPHNLRLAALNLLATLPQKTPLGGSIASALLWSCLDASSDIVDAALSSERLFAAIEEVPNVQVVQCCGAVLKALKSAETEDTRSKMARV